MKETEQLENALKLLREADAERGASPFLETRLRAAFRAHHAPKRQAFSFRWASALGAVACTAFIAWRLAAPGAVEAPKPVSASRQSAAPVKPPEIAVLPTIPPQPVIHSRKRVPAPVATAKASARPAQDRSEPAVQEFIAIPYAPPLSSWERGQVVRVRLPRQSLRSLGIPINEERIFERVPADLLMGEDGVARAIRFVSASEIR